MIFLKRPAVLLSKNRIILKLSFFILSSLISLFILEKTSYYLLPVLDLTPLIYDVEFRDLKMDSMPVQIPNLHYVPYPNRGYYNLMGFRDRMYPSEKTEGTIRIMVLGDSITEGAYGIDRDDLFHEILEKELRIEHKKRNIEVWNCGVKKYNTIQELQYFKHYLMRYMPDIVILQYLELNDYSPSFIFMDESISRVQNIYNTITPNIFGVPDKVHFALCESDLYKVFTKSAYNLAGMIAPIKYPPLVYRVSHKVENFTENRKALLELRELCVNNGIKFLLVVFPIIKDNSHARDRWINTIHENIFPKSEVIHLMPEMLKRRKDISEYKIYDWDNLHPNHEGHKLASDLIRERLHILGWLESDDR